MHFMHGVSERPRLCDRAGSCRDGMRQGWDVRTSHQNSSARTLKVPVACSCGLWLGELSWLAPATAEWPVRWLQAAGELRQRPSTSIAPAVLSSSTPGALAGQISGDARCFFYSCFY